MLLSVESKAQPYIGKAFSTKVNVLGPPLPLTAILLLKLVGIESRLSNSAGFLVQ